MCTLRQCQHRVMILVNAWSQSACSIHALRQYQHRVMILVIAWSESGWAIQTETKQ
jgi:deferrochelatase/peroxidase EfeB